MTYKVINDFRDKQDKNRLYKKGDSYPKGRYKPTKKRINELLKKHSKFNCAFIEEVKDESEE